MTPDGFKRFWRQAYPKAPPVAAMLREAYGERWLRIHALPESKRYATTAEEEAEILRRHRTVLADVLEPTRVCVLILTGYSETPLPILSDSWLQERYPDNEPLFSVKMDTEIYWHFFMVVRTPEANMFNDLLRQVAEDAVADIMFVGIENANLYAPYDGGADIFLASALMRDTMRLRYADWLSSHPAGL